MRPTLILMSMATIRLPFSFLIGLLLASLVNSRSEAPPRGDEAPSQAGSSGNRVVRELIRDPHFRSGFNLIDPKPGRRLAYGRLAGVMTNSEPAWDLDQWSSRLAL